MRTKTILAVTTLIAVLTACGKTETTVTQPTVATTTEFKAPASQPTPAATPVATPAKAYEIKPENGQWGNNGINLIVDDMNNTVSFLGRQAPKDVTIMGILTGLKIETMFADERGDYILLSGCGNARCEQSYAVIRIDYGHNRTVVTEIMEDEVKLTIQNDQVVLLVNGKPAKIK